MFWLHDAYQRMTNESLRWGVFEWNDKTMDWEDTLPALELAYNTRVHRATLCNVYTIFLNI